MDFVNIFKGGFKSGKISYEKKDNRYVIYQHSRIFWIKSKNKLTSCENIETLKELDKRCELGLFKKTSENKITENYNIIPNDYKKLLLEYKEKEYISQEELPYLRVWTKPVTSYATNYSKFDISLSPIKNHIFNRMKSQLKVIEAGFYRKALIASSVGPYNIDLKHCLKEGQFHDGNALLVDENRNHSDWAKYIKKLVQNPNLIEDMGNRLYETVKVKYHLDTVTKNRSEWYKTLVK